ncbi:hypothetical protein acsn021_13510 [Anaerocolumna cellulosilytica]|uniref:Uncharacterized protein n=1 Tax=Anaerocolumna cellulosilytica TaxID=433286 RepID=A0A6S6R2R1_9FIRM|nr:hypothetical protein [Anaerocolumna cellulosilytica]MBB5195540.1 hypothetical protein [Anaerocolumna cellulosilytica]BCJ93782.1 hypothetical protein acsn021_13510 [Anaerocolumna cellulosilytica]
METEKYVKTPISLEQLFKLDTDLLEEYDLYVKVDIVKYDENTIVYLDDPLDVDDDTEDEIDFRSYFICQENARQFLLNPEDFPSDDPEFILEDIN